MQNLKESFNPYKVYNLILKWYPQTFANESEFAATGGKIWYVRLEGIRIAEVMTGSTGLTKACHFPAWAPVI